MVPVVSPASGLGVVEVEVEAVIEGPMYSPTDPEVDPYCGATADVYAPRL
jgi:hypothetical protein